MDKIKELLAMDDAGLSKLFGFTARIADAKEDLAEMDKLEGKARDIAEEKLSRMLEPNIYPGDFSFIVHSATDAAAPKKDCNCTGSDMLTKDEYPNLEDDD